MNNNSIQPFFKFPILRSQILFWSLFLLFTISTLSSFGQQHDKNPYNPVKKMELLKQKKGKNIKQMHFLVFGDSKGSDNLTQVLKRSDSLNPDFCLTTSDLVKKGGGEQGKADYARLDELGGWFLKKYPTWPTVGNHETFGGSDAMQNFSNFFGMEKNMYAFEYGNAKFIALPWPKIKDNKEKLDWFENELKTANGKNIFVFKHRPHYDVGAKKYTDVEGTESATTKLYDKYKVKVVFSGHDHIYYRTKRNGVSYIISAGAGAPIYPLKREKDAIKGDAYYGKRFKEDLTNKSKYKFVASDGTTTDIAEEMFYIVSVKVDAENITIEMLDAKTGKVWDKTTISCEKATKSDEKVKKSDEKAKKNKFIIAAHRGGYENDFEDKAPENSIANIQNAINRGFEMYESDVQRTKDGKFIIMHDPTIDRTTNGTGEVAKMTFEELKEYNLTYKNGEVSEEKIPLLSEFIAKSDGKIIFKIDFKPETNYLAELLDEIKELGLQKRVILRFRYNNEIVKVVNKYNAEDIPSILFRVKKLAQYNKLKKSYNIKMISVFEKKEFTQEHLQIIKMASKENILIEIHTFYDRNKKREQYWEEQIKLPITIFHTSKPILFQKFLKNKMMR